MGYVLDTAFHFRMPGFKLQLIHFQLSVRMHLHKWQVENQTEFHALGFGLDQDYFTALKRKTLDHGTKDFSADLPLSA